MVFHDAPCAFVPEGLYWFERMPFWALLNLESFKIRGYAETISLKTRVILSALQNMTPEHNNTNRPITLLIANNLSIFLEYLPADPSYCVFVIPKHDHKSLK
jgi:hypothetical protein